MTKITTTLNEIRKMLSCPSNWEKKELENLLKRLEETEAQLKEWYSPLGHLDFENEPLEFSKIAKFCGIQDALKCLQAIQRHRLQTLRTLEDRDNKIMALFAADCAESVLHIFERERPEDNRPRKAIEAAKNQVSVWDASIAAIDAQDASDEIGENTYTPWGDGPCPPSLAAWVASGAARIIGRMGGTLWEISDAVMNLAGEARAEEEQKQIELLKKYFS